MQLWKKETCKQLCSQNSISLEGNACSKQKKLKTAFFPKSNQFHMYSKFQFCSQNYITLVLRYNASLRNKKNCSQNSINLEGNANSKKEKHWKQLCFQNSISLMGFAGITILKNKTKLCSQNYISLVGNASLKNKKNFVPKIPSV